MKRIVHFSVSLGLLSLILPQLSYAGNDGDVEKLIDQLAKTSEIGFGYSSQFSGSQFLPYADSEQVGTAVLGSPAPRKSETLTAIVKSGVSVVPLLLKHMDDARTTKIPALTGMMFVSSPDEYDYNRRTRNDSPEGVNIGDSKVGPGADRHTITVGDLCYVALGQIMNRRFDATRYQPSGGLIINSPTSSKRLCEVVRADFKDFTAGMHRALLLQDLAKPDYEDRRIGAYLRLSFYYPQDAEAQVLKQLKTPSYDVFKIEEFVRQELYRENSREKRTDKFDAFIKSHGQVFSDGVRSQLFEDLGTQEANEQHRLSPPLKEKYDARALLIHLYGYKPDVKSQDRPFRETWNDNEKTRFIEALIHSKSATIDAAVAEARQQLR